MIKPLTYKGTFKYLDWINKIEDPDMTPDKVMAEIQKGTFKALLCDDVGILIYWPKGIIAWIIWFYTLPNKGRSLVESIYDYLRGEGFKKVRAGSIRKEKGFMRITGMTKLFTIYEKEL